MGVYVWVFGWIDGGMVVFLLMEWLVEVMMWMKIFFMFCLLWWVCRLVRVFLLRRWLLWMMLMML